ncbi:MAG: bifunctional adenosylcobinamide kinase/adenosylcobinamide-phosphate guanylyltransferase [Ruminococcus flavefaciens]|nr:bifunctional adenosylcobinamide kinase/adenosylcobinamide-phosphate guanylyltransferase [Ruminococcus flavefaciens]
MITLITGGSKCGKSSIAESIISRFSGKKYYIATMMPYGAEAHEAIERHRRIRAGKGFETIEKYTDLGDIFLTDRCAVLLECMGNLCANEMFGETVSNPVEKIVRDIKHLESISEMLVIVTNEVGADGISYSCETMDYISYMGMINRRIADISENVIECVYGIPVVLKGELCF